MRDEKGRFVKKDRLFPRKWYIQLATREIVDAVNSIHLWKYGKLNWEDYPPYNNSCIDCDGDYYSGESRLSIKSQISREYQEITFKEFKEHIMKQKEEFKLPDKWTIDIRKLSQEKKDIVGRYFTKHSGHDCYLQLHYFGYISSHNNVGEKITECHGRTKEANFADNKQFKHITFEEFEKYVLNQEKQQVIGYKFKQSMKKYEAAALAIAKTREWNPSLSYDVQKGCMSEEYLASANVLDEWFDVVYKPEHPKIAIAGYDAKFEEDGFVQFGCKRFTKEEVLGFGDVLVKSGLKIETYNDQVLDVYRYFKKKS